MLKNKPTQCDKIINYIKEFGSITAFEAFSDLGITQLGARVFELKSKGYEFETELKTAKNRYGETVHFKAYKLKHEEHNGLCAR